MTTFCLPPHPQVQGVPFLKFPWLTFCYVIPIPIGTLFIQKFFSDLLLAEMDCGVRRISFIVKVCGVYLTYPITFQKYVYDLQADR
jgi:hypothetical protein